MKHTSDIPDFSGYETHNKLGVIGMVNLDVIISYPYHLLRLDMCLFENKLQFKNFSNFQHK